MSNPYAKAEKSKAKDKRQQPAPDVVPKYKSKKNKKNYIKVMYKYNGAWPFTNMYSPWTKFGKYKTKEEAEKVIKLMQQKYPFYDFKTE